MNTKDLQALIAAEVDSSNRTTTDTARALHIGRVQAFSFILSEENRTRQRVERLTYEMQYGNDAAAVKFGGIPA